MVLTYSSDQNLNDKLILEKKHESKSEIKINLNNRVSEIADDDNKISKITDKNNKV